MASPHEALRTRPHRPRGRRLGWLSGGPAHGLLSAVSACVLLLAGYAPASAHPHVWVNVETTVLFENGSVVGFRHKWSFDDLYAAMAIQGLDTNNDGVYSREELAELAKVNIDGLKDFGFFTHPRLAGERLNFEAPKDYYLEHAAPTAPAAAAPAKDKPTAAPSPGQPPSAAYPVAEPGMLSRLGNAIFGASRPAGSKPEEPARTLSLNFTLPLAKPVLADAEDFTFAIYDPSFFIAFEMAKNDPVRLGAGAPESCRIAVGDAEKSADDAQRLGEAFATQLGQQNFGFSASKPIRLNCGAKP